MSRTALYDEDILLWSEQQADAIRRLQKHRDLPNELDVENVAEEIESVGRSELAAVESQFHNIFVHVMRLMAQPEANAVRHWRGEVVAFQGEALRRYAPSMRQRIDLDKIWERARMQSMLASEAPEELNVMLPMRSPIDLDDLLLERPDVLMLVEKLQTAAGNRPT